MYIARTKLSWGNPEKWKEGDWYPLPFSFDRDDLKSEPEIIEGYMIYTLSEKQDKFPGDIEPVFDIAYLFSDALLICELHNKRRMLK